MREKEFIEYDNPYDVGMTGLLGFSSGYVEVQSRYAALRWLTDNLSQLGIAKNRTGAMGESAGGGLAASVALMVRDRAELSLAFQHLISPMLDDRTS